jgi:hypothetical protein
VAAVVNDANFIGQANGTLTIQRANQQITFDALPNKMPPVMPTSQLAPLHHQI